MACPEVFDQDEYGIVVVLDERPPVELHGKVQDAVRDCPAAVISTETS
jgi:ferredoxin